LVGVVGGVVSLGSGASVVTVTALLGGDQLMPLSRALTVKTYVVDGSRSRTVADVLLPVKTDVPLLAKT